MRSTISFKGKVLYVVERRSSLDNYSVDNPNDSAVRRVNVDKRSITWRGFRSEPDSDID